MYPHKQSVSETIDIVKQTILKKVPAKYIYLYGSHAYGEPTVDSDIDIYVVVPEDSPNTFEIKVSIMSELHKLKLYLVDMIVSRESVFIDRKDKFILEKTICKKGKLIYEL